MNKILNGFVIGGKVLLNALYIPVKLTAIVFTFFADTIDTVRQ